ncbi:MAG: hypothetical protein WBP41_15205 [Saprospiraceae bacterium]
MSNKKNWQEIHKETLGFGSRLADSVEINDNQSITAHAGTLKV